MISTTKQNKSILKKILTTIGVIVFWIVIWDIASFVINQYNENLSILVPRPLVVFKKWIQIVLTKSFIKAEVFTINRMLLGFIIGLISGFWIGILTHISNLANAILSPLIKMIRATPVIAIIILMFLFFKSSTLPVFIVVLMVMPLVWQCVHDGLKNAPKQLLEMARVFKLSYSKTLFKVKLPCISQQIISTTVSALGLAWKSGIAAEVICLPNTSLGILLWQSNNTYAYDEVYAITITVIIISILIELLIKFLCNKFILSGGTKDA